MENQTNIVLILKSGGDFRMSDVYLLATHINRNWKGIVKPAIYCYTDFVTEEQNVVGLTIRPLPNPKWNGWWCKMNMFAPSLAKLRPFLYIDLDTAILNTVTSIVPPKVMQNNFIALRDFYRPNNLASGVMWIPASADMDSIYSVWMDNPVRNVRRFRGDQNFIESVINPNKCKYWQDMLGVNTIVSFKPNKHWLVDYPVNSTVVCFHGEPRIPKAALHVEWVKKYVSYEI